MLYRDFGKTGWRVSAIGQGCWNIGNQWGEMDDAAATRIICAALDGGMNLFDAAESYGIPNGCSEIRLGKALQGVRGQVFIVSKIGHWGARTGQIVPKTTPDMIRLCGHACCGRLRTEWVDLMMCHEGHIKDDALCSVYIEGLRQLKQEGFIREYGISTDDMGTLRRFHEMSAGECAAVELDYSLLNREPEKELLPFCREKGLAVLARGPLARGMLSRRYGRDTVFSDSVRDVWNPGAPQRVKYEALLDRLEKLESIAPQDDCVALALRFVISHPSSPVAIPGATTPEQASRNAAAGAAHLDLQAMARLCK